MIKKCIEDVLQCLDNSVVHTVTMEEPLAHSNPLNKYPWYW